MTLIEVLIIIAVMLILAAVFLPSFINARQRAHRISCTSCLKQVGVAFRIWSSDHNDRFPMGVSTNEGGTLEFLGQPSQVFQHYRAMSNELNTPVILVCPTDRFRTAARSFNPAQPEKGLFSSNANLSYFVGIDAVETNPAVFLSGDRNITNGLVLVNGILELTTDHPPGWTDDLHVRQGNIGLADGSVQGLSSSALQKAVRLSGVATNRLAMP